MALFRTGIKAFLPESFQLVSGPGCPVCVTAQGYIDAATGLAARGDLCIATYGDMLKVPGRHGSLEAQRAEGASILVVYSIRDALRHAEEHPQRQVVFLAVGFETTAPATAAAVLEAGRRGLKNFSVLLGHKLVMPAVEALLGAGDVPLDGFLLPGHVSVIIGSEAYEPVAKVHAKSAVVTGFEPETDAAWACWRLAELISQRRAVVENVYQVAVGEVGNRTAQRLLEQVFTPDDAEWRALGVIPKSGLGLRPEWAAFDAAQRFNISFGRDYDPPGCRCGDVIQGKALPATAPTSPGAARPAGPSAPAWCPAKAPARPGSSTGGSSATFRRRP